MESGAVTKAVPPLRRPSREQQQMLDQHALWLASHGERGKRIGIEVDETEVVDLSGLDLDRVDLTGGQLAHANFEGSSLRQALFVRASLSGARFLRCDARDADFQDADISLASFQRAQIKDANFKGADTTGTFWTQEAVDAFRLALKNSLPHCGPH